MSKGATYFHTNGVFWIDMLDGQPPQIIQSPKLDGDALRVQWHPLIGQPGDKLYESWFMREQPKPMKGTKERVAAYGDTGIAYRLKDNGLPMFWSKDDGFWNQKEDGTVSTFRGVTVQHKEDWMPLMEGSPEQKLFDAKFGPTPMSIEGNWMDWMAAIGASPVSVAMRRDAEGKLWIRRSKDRTWIFSIVTNLMVREHQSGFRHMNHWTPMPEDHPLAKSDWNSTHIPYRDPKFPPPWCPANEVDEWVATGTCPTDQARRAALDERKADEELTIRAKKARYSKMAESVNTDIIPIAAENDTHVYIDRPEPKVLESLIPLATVLSETIKSMVEIGDNDTASALGKQIGYLVGGASWHLRNNRTEYARRKRTT